MRSLRVVLCDSQRFCAEVLIAKRADHPNVLAIVGVQFAEPLNFIVSPWMEHEDMGTYLQKNDNEDLDRVGLVSLNPHWHIVSDPL